jgi:hypothetical protein
VPGADALAQAGAAILAVLAERAAAGAPQVSVLDGGIGPGWSWSQRDEAMARRLLAGSPCGARALAVAGNAHTRPVPRTWASRWAAGWPGSGRASGRSGSANGGGRFWNSRSGRFARRASPYGPVRHYQDAGELVLDLPVAPHPVKRVAGMPVSLLGAAATVVTAAVGWLIDSRSLRDPAG